MKKLGFADDLLRNPPALRAETQSLALSLAALRRKRRQRRCVHFVLPALAAAASIAAGMLVLNEPAQTEVALTESPGGIAVLNTRPLAAGVAVRSQPLEGVLFASQPVPAGLSTSTDLAKASIVVVNRRLSGRVEFLNDRQMLAALGDMPVMFAENLEGERYVLFLEENDKEWLAEP